MSASVVAVVVDSEWLPTLGFDLTTWGAVMGETAGWPQFTADRYICMANRARKRSRDAAIHTVVSLNKPSSRQMTTLILLAFLCSLRFNNRIHGRKKTYTGKKKCDDRIA